MDITKVLTISTAHITEETDRKLQDESEVNNMCISVYDKAEYDIGFTSIHLIDLCAIKIFQKIC